MSARSNIPPRYSEGTRVRVADRPSVGHCRTPTYLRGHFGEIVAVEGLFRDPERIAYNRPGLPRLFLYRVRFSQSDLWPDYDGDPTDILDADVYENWLEPAEGALEAEGTMEGAAP